MLRRTATTGLALLAFVALNFSAPAQSQAQIIPSLWNSIFGPPWYYTGFYGPSYTVGFTPSFQTASYFDTTSFYGPSFSTSFYGGSFGSACCAPTCCPQTACSPCGSGGCSPCGISGCSPCSGGSCPGGVCAAGYGSCDAGLDAQSGTNGRLQPTPDGNRDIPRTYDPGATTKPMGNATPMNNGGTSPFGDRDEGFRPREPAPMTDPGATESFRFPGPDADKIPQKAQPTNPAEGELPEESTREAGTGTELRLPPIDLDDKVTWRSAPERTRLNVRSTFKTPVVARAKANVNSNWTPVRGETKLVKK